MKQEQEQLTFDFEKYEKLLKHPKDKVRKWASEQIMYFVGENGHLSMLPLIREPLDEIAVPILDHLSKSNFQAGAAEILELFQEAEKSNPVRSIRASWCAQALGKLNYQPALPHFAGYMKKHPRDVGLLGVCAALGDLDYPEARELLKEMIKDLEKTRDGGVPYLGDVVVDSLLRQAYSEDVGVILKLQRAWQNEGKKNPRTYSALARSMGENEVYPRLESATLREQFGILAAVKEQEYLLEVNLQEIIGQLVYRGLLGGLEKEHSAEIITWTRQAAEELLLERYGSLDRLREDKKPDAPRYNQEGKLMMVPILLRDQISLRVLDGLNDTRYQIHQSQLDPITHKRQALLALSGLLEIAARKDYAELLNQIDEPAKLIELVTSRRWHVPEEVLDKAAQTLRNEPNTLIMEQLISFIGDNAVGYGGMRAAYLLGQIRFTPAVPALFRGLESEQPWMRDACREALVEIGSPALDYIEDNLPKIAPEAWSGIAEVLVKLPYQRSSEIAFLAWQEPQVPKTDGLLMVQERVGSLDSIAYLWEMYKENPNLVSSILELLCDVHDMDFPELEGVREANRIAEEEQKSYQQGIWQEIRGEAPKEDYEMILNPDKPKKPEPVQLDRPGRNDSCPCGSGKKFKKCCGKDN